MIILVGMAMAVGLWASVFSLIESERLTTMMHARTEASNLSAAFQEEVSQILDNFSGAIELVAAQMRSARGTFDIHDWAGAIPLMSLPGVQATIIGPSGRMLSTTLMADQSPIDLSDREHFRIHLDGSYRGLFISAPVVGRVSRQVTIQISRRVEAADGRFLGVVVFHLPPRLLTRLHKSIDLGQHGRLTLFGTDNIVRARFDVDHPDGTANAAAVPPPVPGHAVIDDIRSATHIAESPIDHIVRVYSDRRVVGYPLLVGVGLDLDEVLAPARAHARQIEATGAIATLLLCCLLAALIGEIRRRSRHELQLTRERSALATDVALRERVERQLRDSEARLDRAQEIAGIGSWELDLVAGKYNWSRELYRIRGRPPDFQPTRANLEVSPQAADAQRRIDWLADLESGRERDPIEIRITRPDGEMRVLRLEGRPVVDVDGAIRRLAGTTQDITERRLIEQQLIQAQKMEAIGNLTGGMAHDFNNVLGVVVGNLELLGRLIKENPIAEELRAEALDGALRGADLTRRLLAFARRQPLQPQQTDINSLVEGIVKLLGRVLGEDIELGLNLQPMLWPIVIDPTQLEAALTNLATNARDAMPRGGQLYISTRNTLLDAEYAAQHPEVASGDYVLIEVSDTGTGIDPVIVSRIFEPFFTTKEQGKGTGLGLSMVFGFMKQSGAHVMVYSEPGRGTTIQLYLPRSQATEEALAERADQSPVIGGHEIILVTEDNAPLRRAAVRQLTALGYMTFEAENAAAALRVLAGEDRVDLLFTDVVMPGEMDGIELAQEATRLHLTLPVLLTSGFPDLRRAGERMTSPRHRRSTSHMARMNSQGRSGRSWTGMTGQLSSERPIVYLLTINHEVGVDCWGARSFH